MAFAGAHYFVLSCNLHSGSEVANYPWDTRSVPTADVAWWQYVCRQYADTAHAYSPADYFTDLNDGITDGYDWYRITGGRQDYMNYFHHDCEFTLKGESYNITFSASGFNTKILKGIKVQDGRLRVINVMLKSTVSGLREPQAFIC